MKTLKTFAYAVVMMIAAHDFVLGQWTTSDNNIYNSNSGNVGIGVQTPAAKLEIRGSANSDTPGSGLLLGLFGNYGFRQSSDTYKLNLDRYYGGWQTPFMSLDRTNGNVGIGTTSPTNKLDVIGVGYFSSNLTIGNTSPGGWKLRVQGANTSTPGAYINGYASVTGNLGIGTTSPNVIGFARALTLRGNSTDHNVGLEIVSPNVTGSNRIGEVRFINQDNASQKYFSGIRARRDGADNSIDLQFTTYNGGVFTRAMTIDAAGNVGIGSTSPDKKLVVNGEIKSEELILKTNIPGPDYVFEADYNLMSLEELEASIQREKHLPEIPSAREFAEEGIRSAEMQFKLLQKIEELTLYMIEQNKEMKQQNEKIASQQREIDALKRLVNEK